MGTLTHFNLTEMRHKYGLRHLVETGTGIGDSMAFALHFGFDTLHTSEIEPALVTAATARLSPYGVSVHNKNSLEFLQELCPTLPPDEPALFWLDAHFPGVDYHFRNLQDTTDQALMLPLESELRAIMASRPNSRDVILIDDIRIYADGPFAHGWVSAYLRPACPIERSIDFIHRICGATHNVKVIYDHEGYALLTPKVGV